jgi:hypothetical protein
MVLPKKLTPVTLPPGRLKLETRPVSTGSTHKRGRKRWQSIILSFRPAVLDHHIFALDISGFIQTVSEGRKHLRRIVR